MSTTHQTAASAQAITPQEYGTGARLSIHPHTDDFAQVILGAINDAAEAGLTAGLALETDEVSTYVGVHDEPAEQRLAQYIAAVIGAASRRTDGGHVVAHILLSRGCPCVRSCELAGTELPSAQPVDVAPTGVRAVAHWVLYPLLEPGAAGGDHMGHIKAGIAAAEQHGTVTGPTHYATRLEGDVAEVLATAIDAWAQVGSGIPHVVSHLTVSVGSPNTGR